MAFGGLPRFFGFCSSGRSRTESASSKLWTRRGQKNRHLHVERQPALIASDTYHLRRHRRIDRHLVLVIDSSSGLEGLCAHWLPTGLVRRILKNRWPVSARKDQATATQHHVGCVEQRDVEGVAAVANRRADGVQATMNEWRENYRGCSALLG